MNQYDSIHSDDLGDVVGDFKGTAVREWYPAQHQERYIAHLNACVAAGKRNPQVVA